MTNSALLPPKVTGLVLPGSSSSFLAHLSNLSNGFSRCAVFTAKGVASHFSEDTVEH